MRIKIGTMLALLILLVLPQTVFALGFEQYINYETGSWPEAVAIGDVNGDGKNDVVMTTSFYFDSDNDYKLFVFLQNSDGVLNQPIKYPVSGDYSHRPTSVAICDLNNDGKNDVAVGNNNRNIEIFTQNQTGGLNSGIIYNTTNSLSIKTGDFNNDGLMDVAGIGWDSGSINILFQQSDGLLGTPVTYTVQYGGYNELEAGDVNNDGLTDLIVMSGQNNSFSNIGILYQQANGFSQPAYYRVGVSVNTNGVGVGDINNDKLNDVIVSYGGNQPSSIIGTFNQNTQGTLDLVVNYEAYDCPEAVEVADVNSDGRMDVLVLNGGWNALSLYLQDTNGRLMPYSLYQVPYASHYNPQGLAVGDFNSDGEVDVAIADYNNGLVVLYNSPKLVPVTGIKLNTNNDTLLVGETDTLIATITPDNATNKSIKWVSDNPKIARVDDSGMVTGIASGTANITATTMDGSNLTATCFVTVQESYVAVTGVELSQSTMDLDVNTSQDLRARIIPTDATIKDVTWTSSDTEVAVVSKTGMVTGIAPGTAAITVTTMDGGFKASCLVFVQEPYVPVTGVTLNKTIDYILVNDTDQLIATIVPTGATTKDVTWTSSNTEVATVSNTGLVTALKPGTTDITVYTLDGCFTATCTVNVPIIPVTGVTLNKTIDCITVNSTDQLIATISPTDATNKDVTWTSSNSAIATVSSTGLVTGLKPGTTIITVKTLDATTNGGFTATCEVTVKKSSKSRT